MKVQREERITSVSGSEKALTFGSVGAVSGKEGRRAQFRLILFQVRLS